MSELIKQDAMSLVAQAVSNGAQLDHVDKLIELVKFNDEREALKAFNSAFTKAQASFPAIEKTKKAHNSYYAPLPEIVRQIRPILQENGLSFRHSISEQSDKTITVTCILAHEQGHSESASLTAGADTTGSKNSIQAIGSSQSYLRRYTLEAVCGIVTCDMDDDGNSIGQTIIETISENQAADLDALIDEASANKKNFLSFYKIKSTKELPQSKLNQAVAMLEMKRKAL